MVGCRLADFSVAVLLYPVRWHYIQEMTNKFKISFCSRRTDIDVLYKIYEKLYKWV